MSERRDFLKKAAAGAVAAGSGLTATAISGQKTFAKEVNVKSEIKYRTLGSTGYKVSEIGFGAMNTRNAELIHASIDAGLNYVDTAHVYMNGVNEEVVGSVMKTKRNKVFLTTKIEPENPKQMAEKVGISLNRLKTDHVDLLLLHSIDDKAPVLNDDYMKVFDEARKKGQTRFVGFSTHAFKGEVFDAAMKAGFWQAVLASYNYQSPPEVGECIEKARKSGIAIIGMKNLLNVKTNLKKLKGDINEDKKSKISLRQALLKWVLNNPNVDLVIPGMETFEHLTENLEIMGTKLGINDYELLEEYSLKLAGASCLGVSGCTGCREKCPAGVDVMQINRSLVYLYGYGNPELAAANYSALSRDNRLDKCDNCETCKVKCVNGQNLTDNIRRARELFL